MSTTARLSIEYVAATGAIVRVHLARPAEGGRLPRGHAVGEFEVEAQMLARVMQYRVEAGRLVLAHAPVFRAMLE